MDDINKPRNDIMDNIASYSQKDIENFYYKLKDDYDSQIKLNKVLKEANVQDNFESVKRFVARNSNEIDYQLERLKDITKNLKEMVIENQKLKNDYENMTNSNEYNSVSEKLKEIKEIKEDINHFLRKAGI